MRLLFTGKIKTKVVSGGETFVQKCPECGKRATFHEVETKQSYGVFFVDLIDDSDRGFLCGECHEVFDFKDDALPEAAPTKTPAELAAEARVAEQRRLAAAEERKRLAEAKAVRIDDELAELKKRMGR